MARPPKASYDDKAGCFYSSAIGEIRISKGGRAYRSRVYNRELTHKTKDRLAAQAWLQAELERMKGGLRPVTDPTFEQVSEYYLQEAEERLGPEAYERAAEQLERFGSWPSPDDPNRHDLRRARTITRDDAERYRDALLKAGLSPAYVSDGLLKTLKACYRWAATVPPDRYPGLPLPSNPMAGLRGVAVPRRAPRAIEPLAVSRFLRWAWRRALAMGDGPNGIHARSAVVLLMTLRDTGARPKDLCVAEWDDFKVRDDGWGIIRMPAWKWKNGWKTGEERVIAVPPHCVRRIEEIRVREGRHPTRIFTHRRGRGQAAAGEGSAEAGEPWVWLDHVRKRKGDTKALQRWFGRLREAGAEAGYRLPEGFRLYFNRSYYSTESRRRGVNDVTLAKAMGTSVRMLDRNYTDLDEEDILGVAKAAREPRKG